MVFVEKRPQVIYGLVCGVVGPSIFGNYISINGWGASRILSEVWSDVPIYYNRSHHGSHQVYDSRPITVLKSYREVLSHLHIHCNGAAVSKRACGL